MPQHSRRAYDHRIKEEIIRAGDPGLFPELDIPRSTAASWIRRGLGEVVSLDPDDDGFAPRDHVARLERRVAMLTAVLRLVLALLRLSGFTLASPHERYDGFSKKLPRTQLHRENSRMSDVAAGFPTDAPSVQRR